MNVCISFCIFFRVTHCDDVQEFDCTVNEWVFFFFKLMSVRQGEHGSMNVHVFLQQLRNWEHNIVYAIYFYFQSFQTL